MRLGNAISSESDGTSLNGPRAPHGATQSASHSQVSSQETGDVSVDMAMD
jgi:hypothetical protein